MNARQRQIAQKIAASPNGITDADTIAGGLGYRPHLSGRLAVTSSLRAMERAGLVGRIPPENQWDHARWFLRALGKAALKDGGTSGN